MTYEISELIDLIQQARVQVLNAKSSVYATIDDCNESIADELQEVLDELYNAEDSFTRALNTLEDLKNQ